MLEMFSLKGKNVIVTGANTGLGQGMCVAFAKAGANVCGVARRSCEETKKLVEENGAKFVEVMADLSSTEPVKRIIDTCIKELGSADVLVNNAGMIKREDAINVTEADWNMVLNVNLNVVFFLSQEFARRALEDNRKAKIINICSMLSYQGGIRVPSYTASKSAVCGITKALCNEWAAKGINVNAIAPGYMETNNTKDIKADSQRSEAILDRIPQGRWGKPSDLMGTAIFLASSASDYINGFTIAVDGGWLAR